MRVLKRDGVTVEQYKASKVAKAISKAAVAASEKISVTTLSSIVSEVEEKIEGLGGQADVEQIQEAVETALMSKGLYVVAKHYIRYRQMRTEARAARTPKAPDPNAIANYIHASKYARYLPDLNRREVYEETVDRVKAMHLKRFGKKLGPEIEEAFDLVKAKRVLPSMRSMQFAGPAIEKTNARQFNCSATVVDRWLVFGEVLYLLLCGCGVGYSVESRYVDKLPTLLHVNEKRVTHHIVEDTIEGWASALDALIDSFIEGYYVEFSYAQIRSVGSELKTSGGKAPGHLGLKRALERIRSVLVGAQGRKLTPIECHTIMCHAADAVLSGGVRRSSLICLFDLDDRQMLDAKTGDWWRTNPWFSNANNSVVLYRDSVTEKEFKDIISRTRQWGEPGFHFVSSDRHKTNPCAEVALEPFYDCGGNTYSGFAFCNLCEINAAKLTSYEDFERAAWAATLIGTLQAAYTNITFLDGWSQEIAKRDALLGIGMTGMFDAPHIACNPEYQRKIAGKILEWNEEFAKVLGIQPAARTTLIKPSGTTSLELGCVASGHHPHHAKRYIRRVTANETEPVFQAFKAQNPHMCVRKPNGDWVIEFPVEAPPGAITRKDVGAIEFLEMVKSTQVNWVMPGSRTTHMYHNVSNTVTVKPEEWDAVADYIWANREFLTGVSLLGASGDKDYAFAPMEEVQTPADELRWNQLIESYTPLDYMKITETEDGTELRAEVACAGGACEV